MTKTLIRSEPKAYEQLRQHRLTCDKCNFGLGIVCARGKRLHDAWAKLDREIRQTATT